MTILQPNGVEAIHPIGVISGKELKLVQAAIPELATNIDKVSRSVLDWVWSYETDRFLQGVKFIESSKL
jgi:hypothetical protein